MVSTTATTGVGVDELSAAVDAHRDALSVGDVLADRRAQRWRAEVRSHLVDRLLGLADGAVDGLEPTDRPPDEVARGLVDDPDRGWGRAEEGGR